jgi:hypothetical protein
MQKLNHSEIMKLDYTVRKSYIFVAKSSSPIFYLYDDVRELFKKGVTTSNI